MHLCGACVWLEFNTQWLFIFFSLLLLDSSKIENKTRQKWLSCSGQWFADIALIWKRTELSTFSASKQKLLISTLFCCVVVLLCFGYRLFRFLSFGAYSGNTALCNWKRQPHAGTNNTMETKRVNNRSFFSVWVQLAKCVKRQFRIEFCTKARSTHAARGSECWIPCIEHAFIYTIPFSHETTQN